MSFGTTGRAMILNRIPLRQRFIVNHPVSMADWGQDPSEMIPDYVLTGWAKQVDEDPRLAPPGWDADGRPVET
jgi:hypothetical protein